MMLFYSLAIHFYAFATLCAAPFHRKARIMRRGQRQTFRLLREKIAPNATYLWFHAASLGEFEQGRPVMEQLKARYPHYRLLLTFFSPSGYEVQKNYPQADVVCYLPFDTPSNARRFVRLARPAIACFVKYDFWANYLFELHRRSIPVYSLSSVFRPQQWFFRPCARPFLRALRCFTCLFVQDEKSERLLARHRIGQVCVVGDTRFDRVLGVWGAAGRLPLVEAFLGNGNGDGARPVVVVAGSSHAADEGLLIPYFNEHPNLKLIIAPHEIDGAHLRRICARLRGAAVCLSEAEAEAEAKTKAEREGGGIASVSGSAPREPCGTSDATGGRSIGQKRCLIIDRFGLLASLYRYADIAYVGGGFGKGVHNILEAAVYAVPVVFGPKHRKFGEACELLGLGGAFAVVDRRSFCAVMDRLAASAEARGAAGAVAGQFVKSHAGATERILRRLFPNA